MSQHSNVSVAAILTRASVDRRLCSKACDLLEFYASNLLLNGPSDLHDFDALHDFAEPPAYLNQLIDEWDGLDPEMGLSYFESISDAIRARITECNIEKLTSETVQIYWNEITGAIHKKL